MIASRKRQEARMNVSAPGQGLLKSGGAIIPFDARIPQEGTLYNLYQTQFGER